MKFTLLAIALLLMSSPAAVALESFSLSLRAPDLALLRVGAPITIDVVLLATHRV